MSVSRRSFLACLSAAVASSSAKLKYDTFPGVKFPGPVDIDALIWKVSRNRFHADVWDTVLVEPETASTSELFFPPLPPQFMLTSVVWSVPSDTLARDFKGLCNAVSAESARVVMMRNGKELLRLSLASPFWRFNVWSFSGGNINFEPAVLLTESDQFCLRFECPALELSRPVSVRHTLQGIATL